MRRDRLATVRRVARDVFSVNVPKRVEELVEEIKKKNPDYSDEQAWATAWSVYCRHVSPGSDHCHRDPSEYLTSRGSVVARISNEALRELAKKPLIDRLS